LAQGRSFCNPPHESTAEIFQSVASELTDEIQSHVYLFSKDISGKAVEFLIVKLSEALKGSPSG
jgi:hypothetical protein